MASREHLTSRPRADLPDVREHNRCALLRELRVHAPLSRASLAHRTGLTPATVSSLVSHLLERGEVKELGSGAPGVRGRPAILLSLDAASRYFVGLQVGAHESRLTLVDALGEPVASQGWTTGSTELETWASTLERSLDELIASAEVPRDRIVAAAACMPGVIDDRMRVESPLLGWSDAPVKDALERAIAVPVTLATDVEALAVLELERGVAKQSRHTVVLSPSGGPSVAMLLDARLYRGARGLAASIDHCPVPGLSRRCACGRTGCLASIASPDALVRAWNEAMRASEPPRHAALEVHAGGVDRILEMAADGDATALEILEEAGQAFTEAWAWVVAVVNPDLMLLAGGFEKLPDAIFEGLREQLISKCPPESARHLRVERSVFGMHARAHGAALIALRSGSPELDSVLEEAEI